MASFVISKGEIETFPYEHKKAIFFTGISVHELFEGGGTSDHTRSAIEDGYIKPENNYKHGKRGKEIDFSVWSGNEVAGIKPSNTSQSDNRSGFIMRQTVYFHNEWF